MGNSVEKRTIAQFVHDAVEMEAAIYTLDRMKEECNNCKTQKMESAKQKINDAEYKKKQTEDVISYYKKEYEQLRDSYVPQKNIHWKSFLLFAILSFIPFVLISLFIVYIPVQAVFLSQGSSLDDTNAGMLAILAYILGTLLSIFIGIIYSKKYVNKDYKKDLEAKNKKVDAARLLYERAIEKEHQTREEYNYANDSYNAAVNEIRLIDLHIIDICDKCNIIKDNLQNLYSYDIIPTEYRKFECVMVLDHIFKNDLADTVREAILIYRDWDYKGKLLNTMSEINSSLGKLSSELTSIYSVAKSINANVINMGNDLNRYNRKLLSESAKNRAVTEDLIRETQLGRYTNEKLLESNKRLEYYAEEYRMGRMPIR